jgi:hypothetical protein
MEEQLIVGIIGMEVSIRLRGPVNVLALKGGFLILIRIQTSARTTLSKYGAQQETFPFARGQSKQHAARPRELN